MDIACRTHPVTAIHTFYVLMELDVESRKNPNCGISIHRQFISYADRLAKSFFDYLAMICMGEARYGKMYSEYAIEQFRNYSTTASDRHQIYEHADMVDPIASAPALRDVFNCQWRAVSYGGKSWLELVNTYVRYPEVSSTCFVDMVVNKQHNSGSVFTKPCLFYEVNRDFLYSFLDHRRENSAVTFYKLHLFDIACNALEKAMKIGLVPRRDSFEFRMDNKGPAILPEPVNWGFIKLESYENEHPCDICPNCGAHYDDCECWTCPQCGYKNCECSCPKCYECGCVEEECSCDEFISMEQYKNNKKNEEELPHGVYETYIESTKDSELSRPVRLGD